LAGYALVPAGAGFNRAIYWKNGVAVNLLPTSTYGSQAMGVALTGNDLYISGYIQAQATVWKNNVAATLASNSSTSSANSIIISGNDVYVAGLSGTAYTYWKNSVQNILPYSQNALVQHCAIGLDGSDVYIASGLSVAPNGSIYRRNGVAYLFSNNIVAINGITIVPH
jgi:hypothetical protein